MPPHRPPSLSRAAQTAPKDNRRHRGRPAATPVTQTGIVSGRARCRQPRLPVIDHATQTLSPGRARTAVAQAGCRFGRRAAVGGRGWAAQSSCWPSSTGKSFMSCSRRWRRPRFVAGVADRLLAACRAVSPSSEPLNCRCVFRTRLFSRPSKTWPGGAPERRVELADKGLSLVTEQDREVRRGGK